jgi:two-component system phosphate regulon sensor histidine kinase PhoR
METILNVCKHPALICRMDGTVVRYHTAESADLFHTETARDLPPLTEVLRDEALIDRVQSSLAELAVGAEFTENGGVHLRTAAEKQGNRKYELLIAPLGRDDTDSPLALVVFESVQQDTAFLQRRSHAMSKLAHTIRSALTTLQGFSELLLSREFPAEQNRRYLGFIHEQSRGLARLMSDLEAVVHHEGGRDLRIVVDPVTIKTLVEKSIAEAAHDWPERTIRNGLSATFATIQCAAHDERIIDALGKVLDNALSFSQSNTPVDVYARLADPFCELVVHDQGMGMSSKQITKAFEPFYTTREENESDGHLGTGLTVTRHILESHGGYVSIDSEPDKGTSVILGIPLWRTDKAQP